MKDQEQRPHQEDIGIVMAGGVDWEGVTPEGALDKSATTTGDATAPDDSAIVRDQAVS